MRSMARNRPKLELSTLTNAASASGTAPPAADDTPCGVTRYDLPATAALEEALYLTVIESMRPAPSTARTTQVLLRDAVRAIDGPAAVVSDAESVQVVLAPTAAGAPKVTVSADAAAAEHRSTRAKRVKVRFMMSSLQGTAVGRAIAVGVDQAIAVEVIGRRGAGTKGDALRGSGAFETAALFEGHVRARGIQRGAKGRALSDAHLARIDDVGDTVARGADDLHQRAVGDGKIGDVLRTRLGE